MENKDKVKSIMQHLMESVRLCDQLLSLANVDAVELNLISEPVKKIQRATAEAFGIGVSHMLAGDRYAENVIARQTAIALACELTNLGAREITRQFGYSAGSRVVVVSKAKVAFERETQPTYAALYAKLKGKLQAELASLSERTEAA